MNDLACVILYLDVSMVTQHEADPGPNSVQC